MLCSLSVYILLTLFKYNINEVSDKDKQKRDLNSLSLWNRGVSNHNVLARFELSAYNSSSIYKIHWNQVTKRQYNRIYIFAKYRFN